MNHLEKQVAALVRLCTAEDEESRKAAREELRGLVDSAPDNTENVEARARRVLTEIGMPEKLTGHPYIVRALVLTVADYKIIKNATLPGGLYYMIAKEFNTTISRAERAMRNSIEVAWDRCDMEVIMKYFGNTVSPNKGKPTNLEFISRVASVIRYA